MFWVITVLVFLIILFQTPILVDLLKVFFPEWKLKRLTSQAASSLLVVLMNTFFLFGLGVQVFVFIPLAPHTSLSTFRLICHCAFSYWVWINMAVNYWYAVLVSPGTVASMSNGKRKTDSHDTDEGTPRESHKDSDPEVPSTPVVSIDHGSNWEIKQSHYCKKCSALVLYMDHHCPFTNNCVGLQNYSYFFLGLLYATIGQGYTAVLAFLYFGECVYPAVFDGLKLAYLKDPNAVCPRIEPYVELMVPVLVGLVVQTAILLFHVFLLLGDITTYDVIKNVWTMPVFRFGWQRFRGGKCWERESRLNVLLLKRRPRVLSFLLPVRNSSYSYPDQISR